MDGPLLIFKKILADGRGPRAEFDYAYFGPYHLLHKYDPKLIFDFKFKMMKKN
jgi:hypothetical protein